MLLRMPDTVTASEIIALTCSQQDDLNLTCAEWDALNQTCTEWDDGVFNASQLSKQYVEFPLGVFVLSTPTRKSGKALNVWDIEAYDHTVILSEDSITEPLYFAAGTLYLDVIQSVLVAASITDVLISDYADTVLPSDREFEIGTKKLSIINILLSEINFNAIYCDANGKFVLSAYKEPTIAPDFTYRADDLSLIARDTSSEADFYNVPNVFMAICSNPDLDSDYRAVWENNSPVSRLSIPSRGRRIVSEIYQPDAIASQEELDAYIRRIAFEANQVYEKLTFTTALMPIHGRAEVLEINHPDIDGIFVESEWALPLSAEEQMTHTARRLVSI